MAQSEQTEEKPQDSLTEAEKAEKKRAKKARQRSARAHAAAQHVPSPAEKSGTEKAEQSAGKHDGSGNVAAAPAASEPIEPSSGQPAGPADKTVGHLMQKEVPAGEPARLSSQASAEVERPAGPTEGKRRGKSKKQTYSGAAPKPSPLSAPDDKAEASVLPASASAQAGPEAAQQADPSIHDDNTITLMAASAIDSSGKAPQGPGHTDQALPSSSPRAAGAAQEPASTPRQEELWLEVRAGKPRPAAQQAATPAEARKARKREKRLAKQAADNEASLPSQQAQQQHEAFSQPSTPAERRQHAPGQAPLQVQLNSSQPQAVPESSMLQPSPLRTPPVQHDAQPAPRIGSSVMESVSLPSLLLRHVRMKAHPSSMVCYGQ